MLNKRVFNVRSGDGTTVANSPCAVNVLGNSVGHKQEEEKDALDNLRDSIGSVVGWIGIELHNGRFHPPASGDCAGGIGYQLD